MYGFQRGSGSKAATSPAENYHMARRRTLQVVVSALLTEIGFESAEKAAVETLTEMMQSCMYDSSCAVQDLIQLIIWSLLGLWLSIMFVFE